MKVRKDYTCPLELVHDLIKGKWKTIIIFNLGKGNQSLSGLRHSIIGISEKMLIEQLSELQQYTLVDKHTFEGYPLKVEYFLTDRGEKILEAVRIMQEVGIDYMKENGMKDILIQKGLCSLDQ
ncbi:MAG: helix-turn-helix transcriptional regulator [Succinivibrio sp.]|nr:helix-turn-helix transcriptional regulator [Succinivibrio sp.]